jgi:hypothetical protein
MNSRVLAGTLIHMADKGKPGRRPGTPTDYQEIIKRRLRKARGDRKFADIALALTQRMGREISADTYRQWESKWMLPLDAIMPVCDITGTHFYAFLGPITDAERAELKKDSAPKGIGAKIRLMKPRRSDS